MNTHIKIKRLIKTIPYLWVVLCLVALCCYSNIGNSLIDTLPKSVQMARATDGVKIKVGAFSLGSTSGATLAVNDVGFQPKYVYFWNTDIDVADGQTKGNTNFVFGVAKSSTERYSIAGRHADGGSSSSDSGGFSPVAWALKGSGNTPISAFDVFTPTPTGFTVTVTPLAPDTYNMFVNYMAFGGDDITDVHIGTYQTPASTGVANYTPLSFEPDYLFMFTPGAFTGPTSYASQNMRYFMGHFTNDGSDTHRYSAWSAENGNTIMNTASEQGTGAGLKLITPNSGAPLFNATFNGFLSNGFSLNFTSVSTSRDVPFLAVKGIKASILTESQRTSVGSQSRVGLGFNPKGMFIQSDAAPAHVGQTDHLVMAYGATDGTTELSGTFSHQDGVPDAVVTQSYSRTKAIHFINPGVNNSVVAAADATFDVGGYTLNWTTADTIAREMIMVVFGEHSAASTISVSGSVYVDDGSTLMEGTKIVRVKLDGAGDYSASLDGGSYVIADIPVLGGGQVVSVYLDDETENAVAVTVTADAESDIAELDLYQSHIVLRHESGGTVTNALLDHLDSADDADVPYLATVGSLDVSSGNVLMVESGTTFNPGGIVVAPRLRVEGAMTSNFVVTVTEGDLTGDGEITSTEAVFTVQGEGDFGTGNTWTFDYLVLGNGETKTTHGVSDGNIVVNHTLLVTSGQTFNAGGLTLKIQGPVIEDSSWWDDGWLSRRKITLNNLVSSENLQNFPVLVAFDSTTMDYSKIQDAGQDLRFIDEDDQTALDYEIESWNESGTSYVWVKVPQIDAGSNTDFIYVYYNNPLASDAQSPAGVWGDNYRAVYHMNQDPSGSAPQILDSASTNDGTSGGSMPSGALTGAKVGNGINFDGANDYINLGKPAGLNDVFQGGATYSTWIYLNGWGESNYGRLFDKYHSSGAGSLLYLNNTQAPLQSLRFSQYTDTGNGLWDSPAASLTTGLWQHVAFTYDTSQPTTAPAIYVNGVAKSVTTNTALTGTVLSDSGNNLLLANSAATDRSFNGLMDEVRFSQTARSAEWVEAEYNWANAPQTYSVVGLAELQPTTLPFTVFGTFVPGTSTVEYSVYDAHIITPLNYYNLVLDQDLGTFTAAESFQVNNDLELTGGTLDLDQHDPEVTIHNLTINGTLLASDTADLIITGNFINNNTFTHNNGTVVLSGSALSEITSDDGVANIFYNFSTSNAGGKTIRFEAGKPTKFEGTLTLLGTQEGSLVISSTSTTRWELWAVGSITVSKLLVLNSGCYEGTNSISRNVTVLDGGNNDLGCWAFVIRGGALITVPTDGGSGGSGAVGGGNQGSGSGGTDNGSGGEGAESGGGSSGGGSASP